MRVLVGYPNRIPALQERLPLPGREQAGDDIFCFGEGYTPLTVEPGEKWETVLGRLPAGWKPDVYVHWSPEYNAIPEGLQDADCLTVAAFGDWNLGGQTIHAIGDMFDVAFADRNGCDALRRAGLPHVEYTPLWAFDPALHRRLPEIERDIDILMIGNFNHNIQWERSLWLARVARLSAKHNVLLTAGLYDDAYTQTMNRAKIVFNRSIRGEINMRAYEAPACGALLFYEAENCEIRDIYTDREHCVLYGEDDLESLLEFYLTHDAERERIAEAGWQQVQAHTYANHFARLLAQITPYVQKRQAGQLPSRRFSQRSPQEQVTGQATQWLFSSQRVIYPRIERYLSGAETTAEVANIRAVLQAEWAKCLNPGAERDRRFQMAAQQAQRALQRAPSDPVAAGNLASILLHAGHAEAGEQQMRQAAQGLTPRPPYLGGKEPGPNPNPFPEREGANVLPPPSLPGKGAGGLGITFPRQFDIFDVLLERAHADYRPDTSEGGEAICAVLAARAHITLSELAWQRDDFEAAWHHAEQAANSLPNVGTIRHCQARALTALGCADEAVAAYRQAFALTPMNGTVWEERLRLLLDLDLLDEADALLQDCVAITKGAPLYNVLRPTLDRLQRELQTREQGKAGPDQSEIENRKSKIENPYRLLALPDWNEATEWQEVVRGFACAYRPSDPALLLLRVEPQTDANAILRRLERFLTRDLRLPADALPNITLFNQPLAPREYWKLVRAANVLIATPALPNIWHTLATNTPIPLLTVADLPLQRAA